MGHPSVQVTAHLCRLLLGHAMDGAEAPDEVAAVNANDFTRGKKPGDGVEGHAVIGIVEGRNQDQIVGDIKIGVAGGEALSAKDHRAGKRQVNDPQLAAMEVSGSAQAAQVFLERLVVGVGAAGFHHGEHRVGGHETGNVVHVAVSVVALDAMAQPDDFFHAQVIGEELLQFLPGDSGIALLHFAQEALFGGQHQAAAIHVNAAAFQHHAIRLAITLQDRRKRLQLEFFCDPLRQLAIVFPVRIFGPGIEAPVGESDGILVPDKDRAGIAGPDPVRAPEMELHAFAVNVAVAQHLLSRMFFRRGSDDEVHIFRAGKMADDIGKDPGDGLKLSRPIIAVVRPGQPGSGVRLPFRGHAIAEQARRGC
jgi:hypothetical protein